MWKRTRSKNRKRFQAAVLLSSLMVTACTTTRSDVCKLLYPAELVRKWDEITPHDQERLRAIRDTAQVEINVQNDKSGVPMTTVHIGVPRLIDCQCCLTLSFDEGDQHALTSAITVRRFSTSRGASTFAQSLWSEFAGTQLPINDEVFESTPAPYFTHSGVSEHGKHTFRGDIMIVLDKKNDMVVRFYIGRSSPGPASDNVATH